jgi:hypothetical protein
LVKNTLKIRTAPVGFYWSTRKGEILSGVTGDSKQGTSANVSWAFLKRFGEFTLFESTEDCANTVSKTNGLWKYF